MQGRGLIMAQIESRSCTEAPADRFFGPMLEGDEPLPFCESTFLAQLGARVREMRALCRMSRRELARKSGISERYIAMIEAGKGNVSIVLLLRIALVFRCA
jgi:DNA-binding XRE family transcriptional regulator